MKNYRQPLEEGAIFHIYNRGNNRQTIFYENENHYFFLEKYKQHLAPYVDLYAYCLMKNHFHFLIKIKPLDKDLFLSKKDKRKFFGNKFSSFFKSYTNSFNKKYDRTGSLFEGTYKRLRVYDPFYFQNLIHYIHFNPVNHGITEHILDYEHSSIHHYMEKTPTFIQKNYVIKKLGGMDAFNSLHEHSLEKEDLISPKGLPFLFYDPELKALKKNHQNEEQDLPFTDNVYWYQKQLETLNQLKE